MKAIPVILIFDIGKTNKKVLLFDEHYKVVFERGIQLPETVDEDGDPCEDIRLLTNWIQETFQEISHMEQYDISGINFSAYGASFVYVDDYYKPVAPLYNYLKPYPADLRQQFYQTYGGEENVSKETASPVLGSLNSGMQLYRLKYQRPELFDKVKYALHLPQYLSYLVTGAVCTDITSIGCHTQLWGFTRNDYHQWVYNENIDVKLPPIYNGDDVIEIAYGGKHVPVGVGLHDSSAALIPYLANFHEPFILLSTGTWCISLNPFNQTALTTEELKKDCLCYIQYQGKPVKASRLFAGYEHEQQTRRLADWFKVEKDHYNSISYNEEIIDKLKARHKADAEEQLVIPLQRSAFEARDLQQFSSYEEAYHQLIYDIIQQQVSSTQLVLKGSPVKRIFVDGGFSKNPVFMHLLAEAFPDIEVFAASIAQATAMGAAIAIHKRWNKKALPGDIIELKYYTLPARQPEPDKESLKL